MSAHSGSQQQQLGSSLSGNYHVWCDHRTYSAGFPCERCDSYHQPLGFEAAVYQRYQLGGNRVGSDS